MAGFEEMWAELAPVGRGADGGYHRQPFTSAEREARAWFDEQCAARDLRQQEDGFGNVVAWWDAPGAEGPAGQAGPAGPAVLTGSHLDSVVRGGAYDGPLGVVAALAALDRLRERGVVPRRPLGVAVFAEEEGSRFPVACLGSRLATGRTAWEDARGLRDRDGVALGDLVPGPDGEVGGEVGGRLLDGVGAYVELHVEQGRDLVHRDAAVGLASLLWPHGRWRLDLTGRADHAGSTAMADRRDPMLTYAFAVLAAAKQARLAGQRATFGRLVVDPGSTNAIPASVTAWLDARADTAAALEELVGAITRLTTERAERDGTEVAVTAESVSPAVSFDAGLTALLADGTGAPVIASAAGHDAGVLARAGIPSAMLFVRNPTGVSHSPAEHAPEADCLAGVEALADGLERLLLADALPATPGGAA